MVTSKDIGNEGERAAEELLVGLGYAIVGRNIIVGRVEIDILAQFANRLVFVEVKTRHEGHLDSDFALNREKIRRLARAADVYMRTMGMPHEAQIDAVLVTNHDDGSRTVEHLQDIALPPQKGRRK